MQSEIATISMLAVAPAFQAAALGRALLKDAEQLAADKGTTVAKITVVRQRESLLAWYERRGCRRTGSHEAFPYGDASVGTYCATIFSSSFWRKIRETALRRQNRRILWLAEVQLSPRGCSPSTSCWNSGASNLIRSAGMASARAERPIIWRIT